MTERGRGPDEETDVYIVVPQPPAPELPVAGRPLAPPALPGSPSGPPPAPAFVPPAPHWTRPAYAAPRRLQFATVGRVVFAGVVLLVFGASQAIGGALGAIAAAPLRRAFDLLLRAEGVRLEPSALVSVATAIFVVLLLLGLLHIAAAIGVLTHRNWGRLLGFVLAMLGTAATALFLVRALEPHPGRASMVVAGLAVLVPYLMALLALLFAGDHFRQQYRRR